MDKLNFLKNELPALLRKVKSDAKGNWGVMNGQQMVEHMAESISHATGKNNRKLHTPAEQLPGYRSFMISDKEFKPNTKNALMDETAPPIRLGSIEEAVKEVEKEIADFIAYFEKNKGATLMNSFFGELNFEEWTHLFHKHATHHCKQFGLL